MNCDTNIVLNIINIAIGLLLSYSLMNLSKHLNGERKDKE